MVSQESTSVVGLRIDVDTLRGTQHGVPRLLQIFESRRIRASFFFSVGPDNMGRHLWRLIRPKFLFKMIRSNAASLYGWDILLRGVFWPGPMIGEKCGEIVRKASKDGHEVGVHAWDHHKWQAKLNGMSYTQMKEEIDLGMYCLSNILGFEPSCSAAPGWRCNEAVLDNKEAYSMQYNSDCRGESIFRPVVSGVSLTPQIPVTLPTYDELIGRNGVSDANYNDVLLDQVQAEKLNVLTIHAEVEGLAKSRLFEAFLDEAAGRGITFAPLGDLLPDVASIPRGRIADAEVGGRDGRVCVQAAQ